MGIVVAVEDDATNRTVKVAKVMVEEVGAVAEEAATEWWLWQTFWYLLLWRRYKVYVRKYNSSGRKMYYQHSDGNNKRCGRRNSGKKKEDLRAVKKSAGAAQTQKRLQTCSLLPHEKGKAPFSKYQIEFLGLGNK